MTATRLLSTCRAMREHNTDEFWHAVAIEWHGTAFWKRALTRKTTHVFVSMHAELKRMHDFDAYHIRFGLPLWRQSDYFAYWKAHEEHILRFSGSSVSSPGTQSFLRPAKLASSVS